MKKLTQEIKRMLEALALANAGDSLTRRQMNRLLAGSPRQRAKRRHRLSRPSSRRLVCIWAASSPLTSCSM